MSTLPCPKHETLFGFKRSVVLDSITSRHSLKYMAGLRMFRPEKQACTYAVSCDILTQMVLQMAFLVIYLRKWFYTWRTCLTSYCFDPSRVLNVQARKNSLAHTPFLVIYLRKRDWQSPRSFIKMRTLTASDQGTPKEWRQNNMPVVRSLT